jgi:phosphopantetheine adenylyltransferase/shikimate kinase
MEKNVKKKKILVYGLPTSGKSTLSKALKLSLENLDYIVDYFNADEVRTKYNDWDFSKEGRERQAQRMIDLSNNSQADYIIADFVAPTRDIRNSFNADYSIFVDTILESPYEDTNKVFEQPNLEEVTLHVTEQYSGKYVNEFLKILFPVFDDRKETVQMLGRFQPWHAGHRAVFERAIAKTGQVVIMVRDCQNWNDSNPFDFEFVKKRIEDDLTPIYKGRFKVIKVPNIVNITYGRDVGYKIEQEIFSDEIHDISATKIRKEMGYEK